MRFTITRKLAAGFTLVELLVAMAIGLITVVVIGQVMAVSEGQKRTTTTGAVAMVNAALALYTVERDIKGAGYGLVASLGSLGCEVKAKHGSDPEFTFTLAPVTITDKPGGAPDEIRVLASAKNGLALPTTITVDHPRTAANIFVDSDLGVQVGDLMIAVPASPSVSQWCSVLQVTGTGGSGGGGQNQGQGQNQVLHNSGQSEWNQAGGQTIFPDVTCPSGAQHQAYCPGDYMINLGQMLDHTYDIEGTTLRLQEFMTATATTNTRDLYPQIVQMQAVYGKDTDNDCTVDAWNATEPATPSEWQQIRAVRLALVARSQVAEKTTVTLDEAEVAAGQRCNTATPHAALVCWRPNPADATSGVAIDLNINDANPDWQRYRYRVFETAVPVRNLIWLQKTANSTCDI